MLTTRQNGLQVIELHIKLTINLKETNSPDDKYYKKIKTIFRRRWSAGLGGSQDLQLSDWVH